MPNKLYLKYRVRCKKLVSSEFVHLEILKNSYPILLLPYFFWWPYKDNKDPSGYRQPHYSWLLWNKKFREIDFTKKIFLPVWLCKFEWRPRNAKEQRKHHLPLRILKVLNIMSLTVDERYLGNFFVCGPKNIVWHIFYLCTHDLKSIEDETAMY